MKKILIASNNPGKLQTARFVFTEQDNFQLFTPSDLNISLEVEETGTTYEQNALLKAEAFSKLVPKDFHVIADDSGINVDALPGQLGVKSRRFGAGPDASDQEWLDHFLQAVSHVTEPKSEVHPCKQPLVLLQIKVRFIFMASFMVSSLLRPSIQSPKDSHSHLYFLYHKRTKLSQLLITKPNPSILIVLILTDKLPNI